jgi:hypothetical protein
MIEETRKENLLLEGTLWGVMGGSCVVQGFFISKRECYPKSDATMLAKSEIGTNILRWHFLFLFFLTSWDTMLYAN